ncbi:hypothetical protein PPTG_18622 [Phytophthora nicotianae INRA-310]|uniref:Zinc finger PHD-type domain-containing protein n=1 Tax=Phytophthora nicotianae (strain INRA-310) TaxID=761204 RepID=W2PFL5_PHYN3|nr:hypothetical protein PPTG_18622 [Phytophthora nicotianae INRA-310]ETM99812.1 hypothetical protein PPTG_18622 [Phytophthora nicotianae INRA-310]
MTQVEVEAGALSGTKPVAAEVPKSKSTKSSDKGDVKTKSKPKPKAKPKPPTNTLDRWFKPATSAAKDKKPSDNPKGIDDVVVIKDDEKPVVQKKSKPVGASRNFVQRYIHINDECRVCECAKTEEATRCELRCATCSMTVHKKCYGVRGELPDGDWNCRRCQFIYDETAWEDISSLIGVESPEGVTFPTCKPLDEKQKLHKLQTDCDFAAVFLFLQRFRRLGLKLSNVVTTLESLASALLEPKEDGLCEELHTRLLANINVVMNKKYQWYVHLFRFLREEQYPPAVAQDTKFPATSAEAEKREGFYFDLPVAERVAILKFLCEVQFDRNDTLIEQIDDEEAESMRNAPIGTDAVGRSYFILEDAATVPNAVVWVCRCAQIGGTDWETVCNDLDSVESLVEQLSLSVDSSDLQLWQTLSRGALKKLTRQQERRRRNERWKSELAVTGVLDSSGNLEGIGRRSLRNRQQVNYANIDAEEEEEDIVADSDKSGDEEEAFEAKSDNDAESETDGDDDEEGEDQPRRSTRNSVVLTKKRKAESNSTRRSKRIRYSPHASGHPGLRRSSRNRSAAMTPSSQDEEEDDHDSDGDSDE